MNTINKGNIAENKACQYLENQGLKLIKKNYRCRSGEIDLIMQDKDELVFVEVRYRKNNTYGTAIDTVDSSKIKKLINTANHYIIKHQLDTPARFDIVGFDSSFSPKWISNAFNAYE